VAETQGELVGFVSGHLLPTRRNTLFIWQVAVSAKARGQKLVSRMIEHILSRRNCAHVSFMETTVTESNNASWALFEGIARFYNTQLKRMTAFDQEDHFEDRHETEILARIGPLDPVESGGNRLRALLTTA
jgi:L-2,4-diaminobutyric acid acetyltransferase